VGADAPLEQTQYAQRRQNGAPEPRIVKRVRRFATENMTLEDQAADELGRDADVSIRGLLNAARNDRAFQGSRDRLTQELIASMNRYFAADADRAVAAVGTRHKDLEINSNEQYAAYDPLFDRITFTNLFRGLSSDEKIVTIIHELLHTTLTMKNAAAQSGYNRDRRRGMVFARHEADLDNIAIAFAKRLGLLKNPNYPPSSWRRYYSPR
jgi:hypothetical protein